MISHFLRHEYTWSNHCITGNVLGWGVTASSQAKDKGLLREIEKLASVAEPERADGIPVEELTYSPVYGFIKMVVIPWDSGDDNRKNKKVFLYQPEHPSLDPGIYMAPEGCWENEHNSELLPPVDFSQKAGKPEEIFIEMNVYDRLPEFLRVVFWCLFEKKQGLNFVASTWKKEEFAEKSGKLMYAIHSLLPKYLRKKAGYVSYTEQPVSREPFYFSREACGENCLNLSAFEKQELIPSSSKLEEYFFYHLSELFIKDKSLYHMFWTEAEQYLAASTGGNEERKLFWLFYIFCQKNGKEELDKKELLPGVPELFYWASKEPGMENAAGEIRNLLHKKRFTQEEKEEYIRILLEGFTKRAEEAVCGEIDWMLCEISAISKKRFQEQLTIIKEKNPVVYAVLLLRNIEEEESWQSQLFKENTTSFSKMQNYVSILEKTEIPSQIKDQIILEGIHLLNQNLFKKENYVQFDALMLRLSRKEQWVEILKDFVINQLEPEAENLSNTQLKTACYVEQLLEKYAPNTTSGMLKKEQKRRKKSDTETMIAMEETEAFIEEDEGEEVQPGMLKDSLLAGYPQGFLTGCALYLCNYALMIGHWKIAVGMAGMWLLLILNFYYLMMHKEKRYPFWKNLGMCILEGYVIEFIASLFLSQKIRLYYFILLGIAAIAVQIFNIYRKRMEEEED